MAVRRRDRPGHHGDDRPRLRSHADASSAARYSEFTQHYPKPGLGGARRRGDLARHARACCARRCRRARVAAARRRRARHHQPARDDASSGIGAPARPVHRAIVWQDRRTAPTLRRAARRRRRGAGARARPGLVLDPYFSGTKLALAPRQRAAAPRERAAAASSRFGTIDSWLVWKLTGGARARDRPDQRLAHAALRHPRARAGTPELLRLLDVPRRRCCPRCGRRAASFGDDRRPTCSARRCRSRASPATSRRRSSARAASSPGMAKNTYGTGCFLLMHTGDHAGRARSTGLLTTVACDASGEPRVRARGLGLHRRRRDPVAARRPRPAEARRPSPRALARSVDSTLGVYLVPAFVGLGAPYWDPDGARRARSASRAASTRAHVVRAALESLAYQTRDVVDAMAADAGQPLAALRVDGGAAANDFLMQFQADMLGVPVDRPRVVETTAMGAAVPRRARRRASGVARRRSRRRASLDRRFKPRMRRADARRALPRAGTPRSRACASAPMTASDGTFCRHGRRARSQWRRVDSRVGAARHRRRRHGYAEHCRRYGSTLSTSRARGFAAVASRSSRPRPRREAPRGHVPRLRRVRRRRCGRSSSMADGWWPGAPRLLFGHSMGGLIAFLYLVRVTARRCAPARAGERRPFARRRKRPAWRLGCDACSARHRAQDARSRLRSSSRTALCRAIRGGPRLYVADPLVHRKATAGFFHQSRPGRAYRPSIAARAARDPEPAPIAQMTGGHGRSRSASATEHERSHPAENLLPRLLNEPRRSVRGRFALLDRAGSIAGSPDGIPRRGARPSLVPRSLVGAATPAYRHGRCRGCVSLHSPFAAMLSCSGIVPATWAMGPRARCQALRRCARSLP